MKNSLTQWAQAGDPIAMFKLAEILLSEGNVDAAKKFLSQSAEKNYRFAAIKLAEIFDAEKNIPQAVKFYKKAAELKDTAALDRLVELYEQSRQSIQTNEVTNSGLQATAANANCSPAFKAGDEETLDFVLKIIDGRYNDIYSSKDWFSRTIYFGSRRNEEYTPRYADALERRRIKNKILKLRANTEA